MDNNYNMYDNNQNENNDNMYKNPLKMDKKKKIELAVLIFLIIWGVVFGVNYILYTKSEKPILMLPLKRKYADGTVTQYLGIGYTYRIYDRVSIKTEEFVPFWKPMQKAQVQENGLPILESGYNVPENSYHHDKYKGLVYFYAGWDLIGTYKCVSTATGCVKAYSGYDIYNIENAEPLTRLESQPVIYSYADRFGFVDDSYEQSVGYGSKQYVRTIYIVDLEKNKLVARYADIKYDHFDKFDKARIGDNGNAIVKDEESKKWGIINLSKEGEISQVLPFEYDSITRDQDTGYYIMMKDNRWYVYNLEKKTKVSDDFDEVIYDVWENNNMNFYVKTGVNKTVGEDKFINFRIYNIDGEGLLTRDNISSIYETKGWIMYLDRTDKRLHFIDYSGEEKVKSGTYPVQLNFTEMEYDKLTHPAFEMKLSSGGFLRLTIYDGRSINDNSREVSFSTTSWD